MTGRCIIWALFLALNLGGNQCSFTVKGEQSSCRVCANSVKKITQKVNKKIERKLNAFYSAKLLRTHEVAPCLLKTKLRMQTSHILSNRLIMQMGSSLAKRPPSRSGLIAILHGNEVIDERALDC